MRDKASVLGLSNCRKRRDERKIASVFTKAERRGFERLRAFCEKFSENP